MSTKNDQTNFEAVTEMQSQTQDVITEFGPRPTSPPKQIPLGKIHYESEATTYKFNLDLEHHKINNPIDKPFANASISSQRDSSFTKLVNNNPKALIVMCMRLISWLIGLVSILESF